MKKIQLLICMAITFCLHTITFSQTLTDNELKLYNEHSSYPENEHESRLSQWNRLSLSLRTEGNSFAIENWVNYQSGVGNSISTLFKVDLDAEVGIGTAYPSAGLDIYKGGDGAQLLKFNTERPWVFQQTGSEAAANLDLHSLNGGCLLYTSDAADD